jgi:hypothetical protein
MRLMQRNSVDLPQPEGPMIAVTACGRMVMWTSLNIWSVPNQQLIPSMERVVVT